MAELDQELARRRYEPGALPGLARACELPGDSLP
jgi:hypothetical protein